MHNCLPGISIRERGKVGHLWPLLHTTQASKPQPVKCEEGSQTAFRAISGPLCLSGPGNDRFITPAKNELRPNQQNKASNLIELLLKAIQSQLVSKQVLESQFKMPSVCINRCVGFIVRKSNCSPCLRCELYCCTV